VFTANDKSLLIKLKQEVIDNIKENMSDEDISHDIIESLEEADLENLFEISWV